MNTKKRRALAIFLATAIVIPAGAAVNATANTDSVAIDAADANMTITLPKYGEVNR